MSDREQLALQDIGNVLAQVADQALDILREASSPKTVHSVARLGWGNQTVHGPVGGMAFAAVQCHLAERLGLESIDATSDQVTFVMPDSGQVFHLRGKSKDNPLQVCIDFPVTETEGEPAGCVGWRLAFPATAEAGMSIRGLFYQVLSSANYERVNLLEPPTMPLPVPPASSRPGDTLATNPDPDLPGLATPDNADEQGEPGS